MNAAETSFKSYLESFDLLPEKVHSDGILRHCGKQGKHAKDKKFAWYRLTYLPKEGRYIGRFGAFNGLNETWELLSTSNTSLHSKKTNKKPSTERYKQYAQRQAEVIIQNVLALRYISDVSSQYLADKQLAIYDTQDAFVLTGKQLFQAGVKQVQTWENFASLSFLVVCMKVDSSVKSLQIICHEKTSFVWDKQVKKYVRITEESERKNKLFLKGSASFGAYLPLLSEGAKLTDCDTIVLTEGYAKSLPIRAAVDTKTAVVTAFSVNNYANVIDNLLKQLSNTELATLQKTGVQGKKFVIASDNDEVGYRVTKRLLQKYHFLTVCYPEDPCKDADDLYRHSGLDAIRSMLKRASRSYHEITTQHIQITSRQYLSDASIILKNGVNWIVADTGLGKTRFVMQYARKNPHKMVILVCPTNGICLQTIRELQRQGISFQIVMQGQQFNYDSKGLIVTTYASLARKFDISQCIYPIMLFVDESHSLSSDVYRQQDIAIIYELAEKVESAVLLTATPHFHHHFGLQWHHKTIITQTDRPLTRVRQLFYPSSELAIIKHFAKEGRVVVEINSKTGMQKMAKWLAREGFSGVYCMNAELKEEPDGVYQYIIDNEKLPPDCKILLTTKLYEAGLNIRDTDIKTVLIFAKKPLETNMWPDAIPLPHDIKQIANRTRHCTPDVFLCLPATCDKDTQSNFDGNYEYKRLRERAKGQQAEYRQDITNNCFDMAKASYEGALRETTPRLLYFADNDCHISQSGLDMAVCETYGKRITYCGAFRRDELNKHGLTYAGDLMFDELTQETELTKQQAASFLQVAAEVKADLDTVFQAEVDRLAIMTDRDLQYDESPFAQRLLWLRKHFEQADATAILKKIGREIRAFSEVKGRVNVLKGLWQKDRVRSAFAIDDFLKRNAFNGKTAAATLTSVFMQDKILRHELDDDWRNKSKRELSEKRALSILRKFADIRLARRTNKTREYAVIERHPLSKLFHKATGKELSENEFFRKSIFAMCHSNLPVNQSNSSDTLQKQSLNSNENSMCHSFSEVSDNYHDLTDYARCQALTFGSVF